MYSITNITENTQAISDTLVLIKLQKNGAYGAATPETAQGFVGKIPTSYAREIFDAETGEPTGEIEIVNTLIDTVYVFEGHTMKGAEPVGKYEEVPAVPVITELEGALEEAYELLYGGAE